MQAKKRTARKKTATRKKVATKKTASKTLYVVDSKGRKTNLKLVATKK